MRSLQFFFPVIYELTILFSAFGAAHEDRRSGEKGHQLSGKRVGHAEEPAGHRSGLSERTIYLHRRRGR